MSATLTTITAGIAIRPKAMKLRGQVFVYILNCGRHGATLEEISLGLRMQLQTVCPRRQELEKKGLLVDSGFRRLTKAGRPAIVWIVPTHIAPLAKAKLMSMAKESA
jgi:hypothetical protein